MVTRWKRSDAGFSLLEVVAATALVTLASGALVVANGSHFGAIAGSFDELVAERAAAARIETLATTGAEPGARGFPLVDETRTALPGARGEEAIREVEPGLLEAEVAVIWTDSLERGERRVALTTRVALEGKR